MAELTGAQPLLSGPRLALAQLASIAWLRWRILANAFRRKGGAVELIFRILLIPILLALAALPTAGAGVFAWMFTARGHLPQIVWVLWAAFLLSQLLNINIGQPGTTFDPNELIRFPMPLRRYVFVRLCFGLLSPANLIVTMMSLAVVGGIWYADPRLLWPALVTLAIFALTNVLFTRMVFAWVDRWLSTRRARELFTAFILVGSLGIQYVNLRFNPGFQHRAQQLHPQDISAIQRNAALFHTYTRWLPPELAAGALVSARRRQPAAWLTGTAECGLFALGFLVVYTLRMRTEFRGENLSDIANATRTPTAPVVRHAPSPAFAAPEVATPQAPARRSFLPATLGPLVGKELLVLRRNIGLFYGLVAPALMVFLFAGRLSYRNGGSSWLLLGAAAYALLGIAPMSYNSFGTEGTGAQFYFMAPVPLREVFFAKNVFSFLLAVAEVLVVLGIMAYATSRSSPWDYAFVLLWAVAALLINTTVGNLRSVAAPKKQNPGRALNRTQSQLSAWMAIGILLGCAGLGFGCQLLGTFLHRPWLPSLIMLPLAAGAIVVYAQGLRGIETYALDRRDILFEELGKKT